MLLIDGYNLLRTIHKLNEEMEDFTDVQLCRAVSRYLQLTHDSGQMIFDGTGPPEKKGFRGLRRLEVMFSGSDCEADTVIEYKLEMSTSPRRLTVVSTDKRLRIAARKKKAVNMRSDDFWIEVCRQLNRKRPPKEPHAKRSGISDGETDEWMETFGMNG